MDAANEQEALAQQNQIENAKQVAPGFQKAALKHSNMIKTYVEEISNLRT